MKPNSISYLVVGGILLLHLPATILQFCSHSIIDDHDKASMAIFVLGILQILCLLLTILAVCVMTDVRQRFWPSSLFRHSLPQNGSVKEVSSRIFCVTYVLSNILLMTNQLICNRHKTGSFSIWNGKYDYVPSFSTGSIMLSPLFIAAMVPTLSTIYLYFSWVSSLVMLIVAAAIEQSVGSVYEIVHYGLLSYFILQNLIRPPAELSVHEGQTVLEKHDLEEQLQSGENRMKHMVANMAHDLKTPLSSFMAGIDLIQQEMGKYENQLMHRDLNKDDVGSLFFTIKESLRTIMNTNSFMLMTINRVLDYAKASKGLKLVPKYETIDLMDTLYLPMNCMKDIQQRISIVLEPLSLEICSHIITDKQWLQENVLCLLSNAVKYSSGGTVTVRVVIKQGRLRRMSDPSDTPTKRERKLSTKSGALAWNSPRLTKIKIAASSSQQDDEIAFSEIFRSPSTSFMEKSEMTDFLHIEVEDTGIGMSDQAMSELFSPFKQNQRLAGGTGLGLFSLAQRVEALHGQCGVTHRRDGQQGSLFWFTMPYRPDFDAVVCHESSTRDGMVVASPHGALHTSISTAIEYPPAPIMKPIPASFPELAVESSSSSFKELMLFTDEQSLVPISPKCDADRPPLEYVSHDPAKKLSILLVDDSPMILRLTSVMLSKQGYEVTAAENGAIALELIRNRLITLQDAPRILQCNGWQELEPAFDVILTDLQMPVMDGLELVKRLREMEAEINQQFEAAYRGSLRTVTLSLTQSSKRLGKTKRLDGGTLSTNDLGAPELRHVVIGLSANSDDETLEETLSAGFDGFLCKPFALQAFQELLDAVY